MDRIIGQFLDFARDDAATALEPADLNAVVATCVERYTQAGRPVTFAPGNIPQVPLKPTAISRLVANLIDNALRMAAATGAGGHGPCGSRVWLDVADRGAGTSDQVERLALPLPRPLGAAAKMARLARVWVSRLSIASRGCTAAASICRRATAEARSRASPCRLQRTVGS